MDFIARHSIPTLLCFKLAMLMYGKIEFLDLVGSTVVVCSY